MRVAIMRDAKIVVDTVPEPEPLAGDVLVGIQQSLSVSTIIHIVSVMKVFIVIR